jgi:hypothetical protein
MIVLNSTTDKIRIANGVTSSAELQCFASWRDRTSTTFIAGSSLSTTSGTSAVDAITGPPNSNTQRIIDYISLYNPNPTPANNVTISLNSSSTDFILFKGSLVSGDAIEYNEGNGFSVISNSGSIRNNEILSLPEYQGSDLNACVTLQSYTTTIGALNRLDSTVDFPLYIPYGKSNNAGATGDTIYWFRCYLPFTATQPATQGPLITVDINGSGVRSLNTILYNYAFRFGYFYMAPRVAPNDGNAPQFINFENESASFNNINDRTAVTNVPCLLVDGYIGPQTYGTSLSGYAQMKLNIGNSSGLVPGGTGFGIIPEGGILYFRKVQKNQ